MIRNDALVVQILAQPPHNVHLLLGCQTRDRTLNDTTHTRLVNCNETLVIHESEQPHNELTVHPISDSTMTWDTVTEVLDFEGSFETRREEAAEGSDQGGKGGEDKDVELHGRDVEGVFNVGPGWEVVRVGGEDGIWYTSETGEDVGSEVVHGADEVFVAHQDIGHQEAKDKGADPGSHEAFNGLFGREFDELGTPERYAANVGEDVVSYDQGGWKEKPDHAFKDVVHDEMSLDDDEVECHVRPGELCELETVVTFLQRANKEDKTCVG